MRLKIEIIIVIVLVSSIGALTWRYKVERSERIRLDGNQATLLEDAHRYKTKDSLNVLSIGKLELTKSEFKQYKEESAETIEDLNIKLRRVQSVQNTKTVTKIEFKTVMKDSLVIVDNIVRDTLKCMEYKNAFVDFSACFVGDSLEASILIPVNLTQVIHRVPKKFWFIPYGTKAIKQEIFSDNPYTTISYSEYIEFKK